MEIINEIWYHICNFTPDFAISLVRMLVKIILIVTAILVALEILKAIKVLDFINKILFFFTKPLGISQNASMPLLIGITCGITYGAGAILASYANGDLTKKDVILLSIFLCICHGVIEDTLLFVAIGANGWIIILIRFILAYVITLFIGLILKNKENCKNNETMI